MTTSRQAALNFFGNELRRHREASTFTQKQLGDAVYCSASLISMIETGQSTPQLDFAINCDKALEADGLFARIVNELLGVALAEDWFKEWLGYERRATVLRTYEPLLVPGLLQTRDYMRAVLRANPAYSGRDLEEQVTARQARQRQVLHRDDAPLIIAILDEGVLRRPIGGPGVMRDQLDHLSELAAAPRVCVQVIPLETGMYEGLRGPLVIAEFDGARDAVYLDTAHRGLVVERADDVAAVKATWESLCADALPRKQSASLIAEAAKAWI